jgi:hypothetical protein
MLSVSAEPNDPHPAPAPERTPRWLLAAALGTTALYLAFLQRTSFVYRGRVWFTLFDDAMISMRYAHNLVRGFGLRWNPGEAPVEGYSNLLWTLWMALLHLLPCPTRLLPLLVSLSSIALLVGNLWLIRALVLRAGGHTTAAVVAVLAAGLKYSTVLWSLQGMEVGLANFLLDAALLSTWRLLEAPRGADATLLCGLLTAMVLTRDELAIPAALLTGLLVLRPATRRVGVWAGVSLATAVAGHLLFRLAYYGAPLPNTYYLKLTGVPIDLRLLRGLGSSLRLGFTDLALPAILIAFAPRPARDARRRWWTLLALIGGQLAYSTWVGGDAWETSAYANRYLGVCQSLLAILVGLGVEGFSKGRWPWACAASVALALGLRVYVLSSGNFLPSSWTLPDLKTPAPIDYLLPAIGACGLLAAVLLLRGSRRVGAAVAMTAALLIGDLGAEWAGYWEDGAVDFEKEGSAARVGLRLAELLPPNARIAVTWAGTMPYFSDLPSVDFLGKNDPHIARMEGRGDFIPGHNKWDYDYSLRTYSPDLVVQVWTITSAELHNMKAIGYSRLPNGLWIRDGFFVTDLFALGREHL